MALALLVSSGSRGALTALPHPSDERPAAKSTTGFSGESLTPILPAVPSVCASGDPPHPETCPRMAIKSDRWIRRMCEEHRMIEPFEPNQVRAGTISYG